MAIKQHRSFAISGDLVESRRLKDRSSFPRQLNEAISYVNARFGSELFAPIIVTRGIDEISGVFRSSKDIPAMVLALNLRLWPRAFRFGVGMGLIDVAAQSRDARRMDGPAFHRAADALERARTDRVPIRFETGNELAAPVRMIESALWAHRTITDGWTARVCEIVRLRVERDATDAELASELGVTKQSVSAALIRGHYKLLAAMETDLTRLASDVNWDS